ncbi:MAG: trigger factor [Synechococcaceae cyanobacterium]|nr:trigger factor [Synechococcaceae cyanobacterium]
MSPAATATTTASKGDAGIKVTTTPRPGSRLAVQVAVPGGRCQASYEAAVDRLSRSVRLPGFRPGKVPRPVLLQQIGAQRIRATALEDLVDSVLRDAVSQEQIQVLGRAELDEGFEAVLERFQPGSELTFTLEMDVEPTPRLKTTRGLRAEATAVNFDPARVEELLEDSRRQLATLVPVEGRGAALGDVAQVAFSGTYGDSGEPIERGSSDGMEVELEEGRMIPGFIEGILGMTPGQTRTVACRFPESYPQQDAAGREASFSITLQELKGRDLPTLDDAFAQQASDKQTLAELRQELTEQLQKESERRQRASRHEALLEALVEQLEVELPETLIQEEIRALIEQTAGQIAQQGMDVKKLFTPDLVRSLLDTSRPEAEQRLRRRLALRALADAETISVPDQDVDAKLRELSRSLSEEIDRERLRLAVADDLLRDALLSWLEANSEVIEKAPADDDANGDDAESPTGAPAGAGSETSGKASGGADPRPRSRRSKQSD